MEYVEQMEPCPTFDLPANCPKRCKQMINPKLAKVLGKSGRIVVNSIAYDVYFQDYALSEKYSHLCDLCAQKNAQSRSDCRGGEECTESGVSSFLGGDEGMA